MSNKELLTKEEFEKELEECVQNEPRHKQKRVAAIGFATQLAALAFTLMIAIEAATEAAVSLDFKIMILSVGATIMLLTSTIILLATTKAKTDGEIITDMAKREWKENHEQEDIRQEQ